MYSSGYVAYWSQRPIHHLQCVSRRVHAARLTARCQQGVQGERASIATQCSHEKKGPRWSSTPRGDVGLGSAQVQEVPHARRHRTARGTRTRHPARRAGTLPIVRVHWQGNDAVPATSCHDSVSKCRHRRGWPTRDGGVPHLRIHRRPPPHQLCARRQRAPTDTHAVPPATLAHSFGCGVCHRSRLVHGDERLPDASRGQGCHGRCRDGAPPATLGAARSPACRASTASKARGGWRI